jgi:hypothetical protein
VAPPAGARQLIDSPDDLPSVVALLEREPVLGIDVEAGIPPRERHPRFALLQVAIPGHTYAIDPLRIRDLSCLAGVLSSEQVLKVFHGIALDRDMLESAGLSLRYVIDLSEVSRSAYGKGEASLAALSRRAFGIGMDKSLQRSDWLHRPISLPMLAYAWRDAELTLGLYHWAVANEPDLVALHTSLSARPEIPDDAPGWLKSVLSGSRQPLHDLLANAGLDIDRDSDRIVAETRMILEAVHEPFLRGRVIRAAGDLELFELLPELTRSLAAPAAHERAAAVRALAMLGERQIDPAIRALLEDPTEEVRQAAEWALKLLPERAAELEAGDIAG